MPSCATFSSQQMATPAATLPLPSFIAFYSKQVVGLPHESGKRLKAALAFSIRRRSLPRLQPWPPAAHVFAVIAVLVAELIAQRWFFIKQDKQMESHDDEHAILQHLDAAKEQSLAGDQRRYSHVYWITHVAI